MPVIEVSQSGRQYYTHTSWFSERQMTAWYNIPIENRNLAIYFAAASLATAGIIFRQNVLVKRTFSSLGNMLLGIGGSSVVAFLGFYSFFKLNEQNELEKITFRNDNFATPLWTSQDKVVDLKAADYNTFLARRRGQKFSAKDVQKFSPDYVIWRFGREDFTWSLDELKSSQL